MKQGRKENHLKVNNLNSLHDQRKRKVLLNNTLKKNGFLPFFKLKRT